MTNPTDVQDAHDTFQVAARTSSPQIMSGLGAVSSDRTASGTTFANMRGAGRDRMSRLGEKDKRISQSFALGSTSRDIRRNVFSDKVEVDVTSSEDVFVKVKKVQKSNETISFLQDVLKENFLFASLSSAEIRMFVEAMTSEVVKTDEIIIQQGDDADYFYILEKGKVNFFVNGGKVGTGEKGKSFGELALLHNCPRTATCVSMSDCKLWKIDRRTFRYIMIHSTESSDKEVIDVLKNVPLFSGLNNSFFQKLANAMTGVSYKDGEVIIRKGEVGNTFYVVRDGKVAVTEVGRRVSISNTKRASTMDVILGHGQTFGERALLTGEKRSATVVASGHCDLLCLERDDFERILGPLNDLLDQARWRHILNRIPLFSSNTNKDEKKAIENVSPEILKELTNSLVEESFSEGDVIAKMGEPGDKFYIVKEGNVGLLLSDSLDSKQECELVLSSGEILGEHALFTGDVNKFTSVAYSDCVLSCLDRDSAEHIMTPLLTILEHARWRRVLVNIPIIQNEDLSSDEEDFLLSQITKREFKKGDFIDTTKKSSKELLYILNHGKVQITRDDSTYTLSAGSYFGDIELDDSAEGETVTFEEDSTCGTIPMSTIKAVVTKTDFPQKPVKISRFQSIPSPDIKITDLRKHKLLGRGSFGKVWLVSKEGDNTLYALKVMVKQRIHKKGQSHFVNNERRIMVQLDHPFIIKLFSAFQDNYSLYMLISLIEGREMYDLLQSYEKRSLPNDSARFYSACMIDALAYIHSKDIIHRDIKAENIMVDNAGYCSIIDFGFAKVVENKAFTLCGTPYYLSPEMLLSKGYNKGADYWAFGVLLYEMLVGRVPFYATDEMSVYRLICSLKFSIPPYVEPEVADLLCQIFVKPKKRIGSLLGGANDFYEHEFYSTINWRELRNRNLEPPLLPVQSEKFDHYLDEEGLPVSHDPSDVSKLDVNPGTEALFAEFGKRVETLIIDNEELERKKEGKNSIKNGNQSDKIEKSSTPQSIATKSEPPNEATGGCCTIS